MIQYDTQIKNKKEAIVMPRMPNVATTEPWSKAFCNPVREKC